MEKTIGNITDDLKTFEICKTVKMYWTVKAYSLREAKELSDFVDERECATDCKISVKRIG